MKRLSRVAIAALVATTACVPDVMEPAGKKPEVTPQHVVINVTGGPQYFSRAGFAEGVLEDANNAGEAVGTLRRPGASQAVRYSISGAPTLLPFLPGGSQSNAYGINDAGIVVGNSNASGGTFAVYWAGGGVASTLAGSGNVLTGAYDVNENNLIVGFVHSFASTGDQAGYWNLGGAFTQLPYPAGATGTQAYAVNDNGDIVGSATFSSPQDLRPILWRAPAYVPEVLPVPAGYFGGILRGISNNGVIVGSVARSSCSPPCGISLSPAVWYDPSAEPTVLPADWIARDVNEDGTVVGGSFYAWIWTPENGVMTLVSNATNTAINDRGTIVGYHNRGAGFEPVVWTTAPLDADRDGIDDTRDNCPGHDNSDQADTDGDGLGDVCDPFPRDAQNDLDGDGVGGDVDNCQNDPNPDQSDADGDGIGDACDPFPRDARNDSDRDGVGGDVDNCPDIYNPDQADSDRNGIGDACQPNDPPVITSLRLPGAPIPVGAQAVVYVDFNDRDVNDTHTATMDWEAGTTTPTISAGARSFKGDFVYNQPGVYTVTVTVTDRSGAGDRRSSTVELIAYIVVYDPNGGFVTGGGWIMSPAGACRLAACTDDTTGKASFGFVSKYLQGASTPSGNTEFHFKAGNLRFSSASYNWLVVAGSKAKFKGEGTINGGGRYGFMITAIDGKDDGSPDKFRIKIWDLTDGGVVYDNKMGSADDSDDATDIDSGSIVIHK